MTHTLQGLFRQGPSREKGEVVELRQKRAVAWKEMSLGFKMGLLYLELPGLGLRVEL